MAATVASSSEEDGIVLSVALSGSDVPQLSDLLLDWAEPESPLSMAVAFEMGTLPKAWVHIQG